jgi:osmoprotectant transport system permease protein
MNVFLQRYGAQIGRLTFEHVWLTASAMLFATLIALPLGVWLTRHERYARPVLGGANVLQTIPSLALFGLLLPVPFLGDRAARLAIVALTGYALLPIRMRGFAASMRH